MIIIAVREIVDLIVVVILLSFYDTKIHIILELYTKSVIISPPLALQRHFFSCDSFGIAGLMSIFADGKITKNKYL